MEVHAHAHSERKKFVHYLWEFLMLFLAVFCGFLAENIREQQVEEQRVESNLHVMIENLKYDTTRIAKNKSLNENFTLKTDSIRTAIKELIEGKKNPDQLYYHLLSGLRFGNPIFNTTAFSQLKSSGLMRLIKPDSLNTAIDDYYDRKMIAVRTSVEDLATRINTVSEEYSAFVDLTPFHDQFSRTVITFPLITTDTVIVNLMNDIKKQKYNLALLNSSKPALTKLYNDFTALENSYKAVVARMNFFKNEAVILIQQIKQAYHFK